MPEIHTLYSGITHVRFNDDADLDFRDRRCFVDMPAEFREQTIPDQYIHPAIDINMNRGPVNRWWQGYREQVPHVGNPDTTSL